MLFDKLQYTILSVLSLCCSYIDTRISSGQSEIPKLAGWFGQKKIGLFALL